MIVAVVIIVGHVSLGVTYVIVIGMNYREKAQNEIRETKLEEILHCSTGDFL